MDNIQKDINHAWKTGLSKGKLTPIEVKFIRFAWENKLLKQYMLAKMFDVGERNIFCVIHRMIYKWIK